MDMLTEHLTPEPKGPIVSQAQPVAALGNLDPMLDDSAVRQALANAEANNQDPMSVTMSDLAQVQTPKEAAIPAKVETPSQPKLPADIPEKFLKTDGTVDVEKLSSSARQLDEVIQKKEDVIKSVEDLWAHYKDSQKKFGAMPNTEKFVVPPPPVPAPPPASAAVPFMSPQQMSDQQLREMIAADMARDPVGTTTNLIDLMISKKMQPLEERERDDTMRQNIASLAQKDPRVLQHFSAVTAKLNADPDLWRLKQPYRAAWLEVKEELRLGEPSQAQAQPSTRVLSPVLGGGTPPPSVPSSSAPTQQNVLSNLDKIDLRDKRQEAIADEAIRAYLARGGR